MNRAPRPALRPFVQCLWVTDETGHADFVVPRREHVLPTGQMHLVLRLTDDPLRLFTDVDDASGHVVGKSVVGGARASFYIRDVSKPLCSVGAQLRPGAAEALFGVPADELAGRHTSLEDLWGSGVESIRDQLAAIGPVEHRLDRFEVILAARLPRAQGLHPAVASALEQFVLTPNVRHEVRRSGYSHRTFISLFRRAVGLTPKLYCRLQRFQRGLEWLSQSESASWIDIAMAAGYSDQAHFNREFREFTGVTPTEYRRLSPRFSHHLTLPPGR